MTFLFLFIIIIILFPSVSRAPLLIVGFDEFLCFKVPSKGLPLLNEFREKHVDFTANLQFGIWCWCLYVGLCPCSTAKHAEPSCLVA